MKFQLIKRTFATLLVVMAGVATGEKLPVADGKVSALKLPFDKKVSEVKFETATFGLG